MQQVQLIIDPKTGEVLNEDICENRCLTHSGGEYLGHCGGCWHCNAMQADHSGLKIEYVDYTKPFDGFYSDLPPSAWEPKPVWGVSPLVAVIKTLHLISLMADPYKAVRDRIVESLGVPADVYTGHYGTGDGPMTAMKVCPNCHGRTHHSDPPEDCETCFGMGEVPIA